MSTPSPETHVFPRRFRATMLGGGKCVGVDWGNGQASICGGDKGPDFVCSCEWPNAKIFRVDEWIDEEVVRMRRDEPDAILPARQGT